MPGPVEPEILRGFTGKIPVRGDFVHAGLPRDFADRWHDWQSRAVIAGSRTLMGDAWLDAFLEAPVWRFVLPPGICGARAAVGLIMPSVDKVGRYFPLTFVALPDAGTPSAAMTGRTGSMRWKRWAASRAGGGRSAGTPRPAAAAIVAVVHRRDAVRLVDRWRTAGRANALFAARPARCRAIRLPCWAISHRRRVRRDDGTNSLLARHPCRNETEA